MSQNGKPMDLLNSADVFADTMAERYDRGNNNLTVIASDGERTLCRTFGSNEDVIDALSSAIYNDDELFAIVQCSLALAIVHKLKSEDSHDTD